MGPALRCAVGRLSPETRTVAEYHFGWVDADGRAVSGATGKFIRPALCLSAGRAARVSPQWTAPAAVAIELVHNYSLIHDDVMDLDRTRRHRPTAWTVFGVAAAILCGDALAALAVLLVAEQEVATAARAVCELQEATLAMVSGQAADMAFERESRVDLDRCLAMVSGKTGALLGCAASLGALLGGAGEETVACLRSFGRHLGIAFQAVDDLLGIWGDPERTGKPVHSDLRARKKSIPVVAALSAADGSVGELMEILSQDRPDDKDLERAARLLEKCGAREVTEGVARRHLDAALDELVRGDVEESGLRELEAIADFAVRRDL